MEDTAVCAKDKDNNNINKVVVIIRVVDDSNIKTPVS